jgi:ATP-dependent RNA helicase DeaD
MGQAQRERVMARLRSRSADLLVCTDVAARGIDIPHLSHVVNFELPNSPEAYTHRIGRTGRAGRKGRAITFVSRRERSSLRRIEQVAKVKIPVVPLPTLAELRDAHLRRLKTRVVEVMGAGELGDFRRVVASLVEDTDLDPIDVAAAALRALHDEVSPDESDLEVGPPVPTGPPGRKERGRDQRRDMGHPQGIPWAQIQVNIGRRDGVRPGDLVGAIANEAGLSSRDIGSIDIVDRSSFIEIRADAIGHVLDVLHRVTIRGRAVQGRPAHPRPPRR